MRKSFKTRKKKQYCDNLNFKNISDSKKFQ